MVRERVEARKRVPWIDGSIQAGNGSTTAGELEPVSFRAAFLHVYRKGPGGWERVAEADTERPRD